MMKILKVALLTSLVFYAFSASAQGGGPSFPFGGGPEPCGVPFDPCPVPIDGGVGFLLAAGLVYGGKKIKDRNSSELNK